MTGKPYLWLMSMNAEQHLVLGSTFGLIGILAAVLQAWLWRFPMVPDPSGRDPHGVSTAPKSWSSVHRWLGYGFAALYAILMVSMTPRLWNYDEEAWDARSVAHVVLAFAIGVVLIAKIGIIRRWPRWGNLLPWLGGSMSIAAVLLVGIAALPAVALTRTADPSVRSILFNGCVRCHGLGVVARGPEDHSWPKTLEEMQEKASKRGQADPTQGQSDALAAHLDQLMPARGQSEKREDHDEGDED